ncbi:hypothetical protein COBT_000255 [Conglomerata obtusa]
MLVERIIRRSISILEYILTISVFVYFTILFVETITKTHILFMPIYLYVLLLSTYNYILLLKKSPGSLIDFSGIEVQGVCAKCNRLKSDRTFHCESCDKCYYKRDHHCPWIGKCIAAGNYKEFYFFIMFMTLYLCLAMLRSNCYTEIAFFNNSVCIFLVLFFLWNNLLICIDRTSLEYNKNYDSSFFKYDSIWSKIDFETWKKKLIANILDDDVKNLYYAFCPFLYLKARIRNQN